MKFRDAFNLGALLSLVHRTSAYDSSQHDTLLDTKVPAESSSSNKGVTTKTLEDSESDFWRFIVLSDMHTAAWFSWEGVEQNKKRKLYQDQLTVLKHINEKYGGELVLSPGDIASYGGLSYDFIKDKLGLGNISNQEAVYTSHLNCFQTAKELFREAGYGTLLATVGDHELGDNAGFKPNSHHSKMDTIVQSRESFGDGFNKDNEKAFLFDQQWFFGDVESRPMGTDFEHTSFAYVKKKVMFVTVDAFQIVGDGKSDFLDRENGEGGEGAVTGTVDGGGFHLQWFENVLRKGRDTGFVKHIIVQAHLPIIRPVQSIHCSGQFLDKGEDSNFWRLMNEYGVDLYLAGEVHGNTATKSTYKDSHLVQIVSRGNVFNNFMTIDASDDILKVEIFNEIGHKSLFNSNYVKAGHLTIDKTSLAAKVSSSGLLHLLDLDASILAYDFEDIFPLGSRQVPGLTEWNNKENLMFTEIEIRGKVCKESLWNHGGFGAQYDAQVCNIWQVDGRNGGKAGYFTEDSRMAVAGTGPLSAGQAFSFGIWFRTWKHDRRMIMVHHANYWGGVVPWDYDKDYFTLILDKGVPVIHTQPKTKLQSTNNSINLADGEWHHIAVSMPRNSCLASELDIYVDGKKIGTKITNDHPIFQTTSGRMSVGGYGYSNSGFENAYPGYVPYTGSIDEFVLFTRPLKNISSLLCQEENDHKFPVGKYFRNRKCKWLTKPTKTKQKARRIAKYCNRDNVECAVTCDSCDNPFAASRAIQAECKNQIGFFFLNDVHGMVNCAWLTNTPNMAEGRIQEYCTRTAVKWQCSETCGTCEQNQ